MRRSLLLAAALAAVLLWPAAAMAKGPSVASVSGPGLQHAVSIEGYGEGGNDTALGILVSDGGFFAQVYGATPVAKTSRPAGTLGPRYEVTYTLPGGPNGDSTLRQDLYPYATNDPVTYMAADQKFWGTQSTRGGWSVGTIQLRSALVRAGLPSKAPARRARAGHNIGVALGAGAGAALAAGALGLLRRKRRRAISA